MSFRDMRYLVYGAAFLISLYAFPVQAEFTCLPLKQELKKLFSEGYALLGAGALPSGAAMIMAIDQQGNFKFIGIDDKNNACEILSGDSWSFFLSKEA